MSEYREKDGGLAIKGIKAAATVLLLFCMLYLCFHFKEYQRNANDQVNKYRIDQACLLTEGIEVEQRFRAKHTHLKTLKLYFSNDYGAKAKGDLLLSVIPIEEEEEADASESIKKEKPIYEKNIKISELLNNEYTEFHVNLQLDKGQLYQICLSTKGAESGKEPIVYQWKTKEKGLKGKLKINQESQGKYLVCKFYYPVIIYQHWMTICVMILLVFFLIWLPWKIPEVPGNIIGLLLFYGTPLFTFWFVERFTDNSIGRIHIGLVALNLLVYFIFYGLLYLICVSRRVTVGLGMAIWYVIGIMNYYVLNFKGAPIVPSDFMSASTAASVAGNYTYSIQPVFIWNGLLILLYFAVFCRCKITIQTGWKKRLAILALVTASACILGSFVIEQKTLKSVGVKNNVWDQKKGYAKNGLFFGFVLNMNSLIQEKPSDYSVESANEIASKYMDQYSEDQVKKNGVLRPKDGSKPNMIFIMNEAFSDLSVVNDFETNQDYMPYIRSLEKNTIKGNLYMSIFGSGTCNSEFEFLTGDSMSSLQNGIIAYTQVLKGKIPNVTYLLKEQGYQGNLAMHPYLASGWNRPQVYEWMGFEKFYSEDDFKDPIMYRKYISDQSNMKKIIELYENREKKGKPFYLFNVTMQNHGGFDKVYSNFDNDVQITDLHESEQAEQYLSLIKKTDESFKTLVKYFERVSEPTIIVMFGDHQPAIEAKFYDSLFGSSSGDLSAEELMKKYETPFIIWANYNIKEGFIDKMSANYLTAYVMQEAGLKTSNYQKFLMDLYGKLPVISAMGSFDSEGNFYKDAEESPHKELVEEYRILQYNNLIDLKNTVNKFFYLKKDKKKK